MGPGLEIEVQTGEVMSDLTNQQHSMKVRV